MISTLTYRAMDGKERKIRQLLDEAYRKYHKEKENIHIDPEKMDAVMREIDAIELVRDRVVWVN